jgi:cobalamin biosynthesis protein CobD/CbiB
MERLGLNNSMARSPALRGMAWIVGCLAWTAAAVIGAALAVFFAATVVVTVLMATALLAVAGMALRARRTVRARPASDIIEARHIGGHSWVAYGWDGQR